VWGIDVGIYDIMYSGLGLADSRKSSISRAWCFLFGAVGTFDLRMMGLVRGLSMKALHIRLIPFGIAGFALCAASGFLFVVSTPDQYIYNPAWQTKMALLAIAG